MNSKVQAIVDAAVEWARMHDEKSWGYEKKLNRVVQSYFAEPVCSECHGKGKIWFADTGRTIPCSFCQENAGPGKIAEITENGWSPYEVMVKLNEVIRKING